MSAPAFFKYPAGLPYLATLTLSLIGKFIHTLKKHIYTYNITYYIVPPPIAKCQAFSGKIIIIIIIYISFFNILLYKNT